MVNVFECQNCNKQFKHKSHYVSHLAKKLPCKKKNIHTKINNTISNKNDNITIPPNIISPPIIKNQCPICLKTYSKPDILKKHISNNCKITKAHETTINETIKELKLGLSQLHKKYDAMNYEYTKIKQSNMLLMQNNNIDNLNITNDNKTNITTIIPFGHEILNEIITDDLCNVFMERGLNSIPELIKYIHFNENLPKFNNCCMNNIKSKNVITYDGNGWILNDIQDIIQILLKRTSDYLENKYDVLKDKLSTLAKERFSRYLLLKNNKDLKERYTKQILTMLYNGSENINNHQ